MTVPCRGSVYEIENKLKLFTETDTMKNFQKSFNFSNTANFILVGDMNDALCDRTWSGRARAGRDMGYICEIEIDAKHRNRRSTEESR